MLPVIHATMARRSGAWVCARSGGDDAGDDDDDDDDDDGDDGDDEDDN